MACRKLQLQDYFKLVKHDNNPIKQCGTEFTSVDANGYHVGRIDNTSFGMLDFTMLKIIPTPCS